MKLTKKDLAARLADKQGIYQKDATAFLESFMDIVREEVCRGNTIELMYFGTFYLWERTSQLTPKRINACPDEKQQRLSLGFRPGQCFRKRLNGALPEVSTTDKEEPER